MFHSTFILPDPQVRITLISELSQASQDPALAPLLRRAPEDLPARFTRYHAYLSHLPRRMRRLLQRQWRRSLSALALLLALGQAPALAATINVTTTNPDIVAGNGCSLIEAIDNANDGTQTHSDCAAGDAGADTINLPANSTHTLTVVNNSTDGDTGLPIIRTAITIEGHGSTIRRDPADVDQFRIFAIDNTGNLTLNETTVSGGQAANDDGGGVLNRGNMTLNHSTISGNSGYYGGGAFNSGNMTLNHSTVSGNSGGPYSYGGILNAGTMTITNSTLSDGVQTGGTMTITNSTVSGNGNRVVFNDGTMTIANSTIRGVYARFGDVTIANSTVSGAGIYGVEARYGGVTIINSTVSGNGRGVFNYSGDVTIINSTVSGNGTGVVNDCCTMTITNSTVSGNRSCGVEDVTSVFGSVILARSLISGNTGGEVCGSVTADNFNLFGHAGVTNTQAFLGFTPGASDIIATSDGTNTPLANILDTHLASNDGPTQTHALVAGSPAIDASPADADCAATDQRGVTRPQGAACDIGAFELDSSGPARLIYGVQDTDGSKSQFFTVDEASHAVTNLGELKRGWDIEGLDLHPTTHILYGTAGADNHFGQKGFLFTVDKDTGALTAVGPTGFKSVEALSFRPTDGTLWGWAEGRGLVTINLATGAATKVMGSAEGVEGLAWNNKGTRLYVAAGHKLFVYKPATNRLNPIASNLPGRTEALEMRPDGLLAVGVEGSTDIQAYDPIAKQPVPAEAIPTGFNDVEGIAWPEATPD